MLHCLPWPQLFSNPSDSALIITVAIFMALSIVSFEMVNAISGESPSAREISKETCFLGNLTRFKMVPTIFQFIRYACNYRFGNFVHFFFMFCSRRSIQNSGKSPITMEAFHETCFLGNVELFETVRAIFDSTQDLRDIALPIFFTLSVALLGMFNPKF